ncbi:MAG: DUF6305 family protein [bacterium]|nr:DUF6305 family protein [bacterium]
MKFIPILLVFFLSSVLWAAEFFTEPVLLTSIGQSADLHTVKLMFKKAGVDTLKTTVNKLAGAGDVPKNGTVVLVVGASQKGLGEARISTSSEIERAVAILQAAKTNKCKVMLVHIGGKERRGELSDDINRTVAEKADYLLVRSEGDQDGFFKNIATKNKKTYTTYVKTPEGIEKIKSAFGK